jgi:hypothetical protein
MWGTTGENGKTSGIGQPSLPPSSFVCLRAGGALLCLIDIAAQPVQASIGRQAPFFHQFESVTAPLFLQERDDGRALAGPYPPAFSPETLFIGSGAMGVEVAHFTCERRPSPAELRSLHEIRQQRRPTPVLVAVTHPPSHACIVTRFGEEWAVHQGLARDQVERLCRAVLEAPDRHAGGESRSAISGRRGEGPASGLDSSA